MVGAGVLSGFVSVLVRLALVRLQGSPGALPDRVPWLVLLTVGAGGALAAWFVLRAYAAGSAHLVVAGLTVLDPLVGVLLGLVVLGEAARGFDTATAALMGAAGTTAVAGVVLLAGRPMTARSGSPAGDRHAETPAGRPAPATRRRHRWCRPGRRPPGSRCSPGSCRRCPARRCGWG